MDHRTKESPAGANGGAQNTIAESATNAADYNRTSLRGNDEEGTGLISFIRIENRAMSSGEHRRPLVPGVDDANVLPTAGVEKRQDAATGEGEHRGDTAFAQGSRHQRAAVGALLGDG